MLRLLKLQTTNNQKLTLQLRLTMAMMILLDIKKLICILLMTKQTMTKSIKDLIEA